LVRRRGGGVEKAFGRDLLRWEIRAEVSEVKDGRSDECVDDA
jgi:hypothetical protein